MPEVLIEVDEKSLQKIEEVAEKNHRSRRAQMTVILEEYVERERKKE